MNLTVVLKQGLKKDKDRDFFIVVSQFFLVPAKFKNFNLLVEVNRRHMIFTGTPSANILSLFLLRQMPENFGGIVIFAEIEGVTFFVIWTLAL